MGIIGAPVLLVFEILIGADHLLANAIGGVRVDVGDEDFERSVALMAAASGAPGAPDGT